MSDYLKMHSPNLVDENIDKLTELFPNCITEAQNEQGELIKVVDFDLLRQELSRSLVEGGQERYRLDWPGKKEAILTANAPIAKTLRPSREESVNFDATKNLFIEGDNLDALKLLQENYLGKVKLIYIDPPYNTGNDFIYNDDFAESTGEFFEKSNQIDEKGNHLVANTESNGRFHSDWLSMMYSRLKLARNLLSDAGVVFISIDDNESHNLRKICDEIFGSINLVAQFPWQSRQSIQNDTDISSSHEYVIAYAKNRRQTNRRLKENNANSWFDLDSFVCLPLPLDKSKFENPDNDSRGIWKADPFDAPNIRPNLTYTIVNPNTKEEFLPPKGRCWRTDEKSFLQLLADNRIVFGKHGTSRPQLKVFYEEKKHFGSVDNTWWTGEKCGTSTQGTKEIISLFGAAVFDTPKPTQLINKILDLVILSSEEDIILDFYAGSSSTAEAVIKANLQDNGYRKFIMVQLPEKISIETLAYKAGYTTIAEISKERIRRAGQKILSDNAEKEGIENLDIGFRVLKIDSSNMKDVYYTPDALKQSDLVDLASNIKEDRTSEDLLFQVMLDWGLELSLPIERKTIAGKEVFYVAGNSLVACFDELSIDLIDEVAEVSPLRFVSAEMAILQDHDKTNIKERFKQLSPDTEVKFI